MKRPINYLIVFIVLLAAVAAGAAIGPATPFKVGWDGIERSLAPGSEFAIELSIDMPEGYYLYADDTEIDFASLEGLFVTDVEYPKATPYDDPFTGRTVDILKGRATFTVKGKVPEGLSLGQHELTALVRFRGCSPTLCYRPEQKEVPIDVSVVSATEVAPEEEGRPDVAARPAAEGAAPQMGLRGMLKVKDFTVLLERGTIVAILIVFLAGLLTSLTPCVWPVIPAVLMFVGVHPHKRFWENLAIAATLVGGLILTYALLGIAVVAFGKNLGFLYQQKWFLVLVVLFFVAMSLSLLGVFDLSLPAKWHNAMHRLGGEGYRGAFLAGIGLGLIASPCAGPVLAALLGYVALQGSYVRGFALLVVYGLGMGVVLMLLGATFGELADKLRGGAWMVWIKRALGIMLLFPAAFYMGVLLGFGDDVRVIGGEPRVEWVMSEREALKLASESNRPVMMEFTASWCPPCQKLERSFFSRANIVSMSYMMVPLRVDATVETPEVRRLINKYGVAGWPSVIFLDPKGRQIRELRVNDYDPGAIEEGMKEAICRTKGIAREEPECRELEGER